ncbi:MAG: hypothetical protein QM784_00470 [Polyangiaceae bacterium]
MTTSSEAATRSEAQPVLLVVDDERNIRRTLQMVLSGEGYQVLEADSAEAALEILHRPEQPVDSGHLRPEVAEDEWTRSPRASSFRGGNPRPTGHRH